MTFLTAIKFILKKNIAFGDEISPIEIMDAINFAAGGEVINYKKFKLYNNKEIGDQWFAAMIMRFYDWEIILKENKDNNAALVSFFLKLFEYFEAIGGRFIFFLDVISEYGAFKINLLNNNITTTVNNNNTTFLMPQVKEADETPNDKTKGESTQVVKYNVKFIERLKEIYENYRNYMDDFTSEFCGFFYYN